MEDEALPGPVMLHAAANVGTLFKVDRIDESLPDERIIYLGEPQSHMGPGV